MFGASWLALEPRIMFDGAAVTTVDSIATEQLAQSQAESSLSPDDATAYPDAAPTGEPQFSSGDQALFDALAAYDTSAARQEIVFLSPSIRDYQRLLDNMSPNVEVFVLDPTREGVQQMTEVLADRTAIDALHLIAEGNEAELHLGTSTLTRDSLSTRYADAFQQIGQSLSAEADVLVYGCNFGRGAAGQSAITTLANLTGADVAASTDLTGAAGLGGDWTFEVNTSAIESAIAVTMEGRAAYSHVLDISSGLLGHWTFDTNADDSSGNNYNGTLTNGAVINTTSSTNIVGAGKVSLDGVNDVVDLTAHKADFEGLTQGTIAMWVKTTDTGELFSLSDTADHNGLAALYISSFGKLGFDVWQNDSNILDVYSVISIDDGQWHHVAVTVDASGNKLYIDGAEASVTYEDGNSASATFFDDVTGIDIMQIGRNTNNSGHRLHYDGLIDDVRVYNRALTSTDMGELYETGNAAPAITNLAGDSLAYSEGAGAMVIEQGGNATVSDVDSSDLSGGTLTVRFTAGSNSAEDVLSIRNQGTGAGQIGVSGSSVTYSGVTIGTFTGGSGGANLVITLNNSATPTAMTALVKNITYQNMDTAVPTAGIRTVRFVLTDGDGGTSANYDTTVTVSAVNDAPTITNLSGDSLVYSEGTGVMVIEQGGNATVSDVDSADFTGGTLTVRFTAGGDSAEDVLSIRNQGTGAGQIGVSGSNVTYSGVTIGTFTGGSGGSNLVITLNSSATPTVATALVKNITYQNTDTAVPTTGARTVRIALTDGDGGTSANYDTTVTVSGVNDAPVNTVPGAQMVGEDGSLVFSAGNGNQIGISDVDAAGGIMHITLTATNGTLSLNGTTGLSFITGDGTADGTMTFTGTVDDINTALNGMGFLPALNYNGAASVQITTDDQGNTGGAVQSDTDIVAITVTAGNDPPVNTIPGPQGTPQNTTLVFSGGNGNQISISDVDAAGGIMQITLIAANGTLSLSGTTGLSFITGDGTADGTMTFTGTVDDINTALNGMGFLPALNYNGAASVQITTDDQGNSGGGAQSDIDTVSIIVSNNVPPVVTMSGGSLSYTENDGDVAIDTGLTVADADNATLAGATVRITGNYVNGEDLLAFTNQLGITGSWNTGTGELTLTGSATVTDYQTALRSITYTNLSNAPSTNTRTVSFSVNDSVVDSAITTRTITVATVNDPSTVSNLSGDNLAYDEGDGAVAFERGETPR